MRAQNVVDIFGGARGKLAVDDDGLRALSNHDHWQSSAVVGHYTPLPGPEDKTRSSMKSREGAKSQLLGPLDLLLVKI